ncbi:MAG: vitamin K epoxide reductase family protein [Candidatus Thermoplasmatota archaeon]|nr:vitamin K epoxide reductase family protein [Candidatus Thermoplasmatota archaeon]
MYTRIHKEGTVLRLILVLSLVGLAVSGYLTYVHYNRAEGVCPIGGGCSDVWDSEYSVVFGIPVALIGFLGYVALFGMSYLRLYYPELGIAENFPTYMLLISIIGAAFSIYLTLIEIFVIQAVCDWCFTAFLVMMAILGLLAYGILKGRDEKPAAEPVAA